MRFFGNLIKNLPTLLTSILLALAVWVLAISNTDPVDRRTYGRPVEIEISGLDPSLVMTNDLPERVSIILSAPSSTWATDLSMNNAVRAVVDLSGLGEGTYEVPVRLQVDARPVRIENYSPNKVVVNLEKLINKTFKINLTYSSAPPIGYDIGQTKLEPQTAAVSGPASQVDRVVEVRATVDLSQASQKINRDLTLVALD